MVNEPSNLTMRREGPSVWDKQADANSRCRTMGVIGFLMIAAGTCFVAQAYKGRLTPVVKSRVKSLLDTTRRDPVTKAAEESFPASDPPAWTPAVGNPAHAEPAV
jgi:hypothetical protein